MHGSLFFRDNVPRKNIAPWLFERWCCLWAKVVLVQSREDAELLHRVAICPKKKIVHIGNGIDLAKYSPAPYPAVSEGKPIVLMMGRLVAEKGTRDFFKIARALHGKARFIHVGPKEHDQRDASPATELERVAASGHVEFVGQVDDVRSYISRCHLVVLPSFREGIPRAAMEASAMGRPVAGYDIRGMREVIPRRLGLLVPKGDVSALGHLVSNLLEDLERLSLLGQECRDVVVAEFSEDLVLKRLHAVYAGFGAV
jgi:glycosyltransferase involved in cell wall biosynthesis